MRNLAYRQTAALLPHDKPFDWLTKYVIRIVPKTPSRRTVFFFGTRYKVWDESAKQDEVQLTIPIVDHCIFQRNQTPFPSILLAGSKWSTLLN